jgi:hypothetical protein
MNQQASMADLSSLKIDRDEKKPSSKRNLYLIIAVVIIAIVGCFLILQLKSRH